MLGAQHSMQLCKLLCQVPLKDSQPANAHHLAATTTKFPNYCLESTEVYEFKITAIPEQAKDSQAFVILPQPFLTPCSLPHSWLGKSMRRG